METSREVSSWKQPRGCSCCSGAHVLGGKFSKLSKYFVSITQKKILQSIGKSSSHFYFVEFADISEAGDVGTCRGMWNWEQAWAWWLCQALPFQPFVARGGGSLHPATQLALGHFLNQFWLDKEFRIHILLPGIAFVHVRIRNGFPSPSQVCPKNLGVVSFVNVNPVHSSPFV